MALDSYSALQTSIGSFLNRSDMATIAPDFITMAEAQINRRLIKDGPVRQMMGRSDATINTEFTAIPDDFMGMRAIVLDGVTYNLEFCEPEKLAELKVNYQGQGGDPSHYSIVGGQIQLWPWGGGGSYDAEITYWKRIPALSDSATTNWLLDEHPDIYLYTSLIQSAPYLKDDNRLVVWANMAAQAIADLIGADKVSRLAPQQAVPIPSGGAY